MGEAMEKAQTKPARVNLRHNLRYCPWGSKAMISGTRNKTQGGWTPGRGVVSGAARAVVCLLVLGSLLWPVSSYAGVWGRQRAQATRATPMRPAPQAMKPAPRENGKGQGNNPVNRPAFNAGPAQMRPGVNGGARPGHLGDWLNNHQNLSPQQQEEQLRREPGFNRLSPDQQARVLNRLRTLDARPPEQRERMIQRNEMFESLSPGQKADVRSSAETMRQMPGDRQAMVRRAFNDLRQIPPEQRAAILNSARFSQTFSPDERHVLGSLLSIEPYQPR
jgi:Protein of unknown function (DUF3106)